MRDPVKCVAAAIHGDWNRKRSLLIATMLLCTAGSCDPVINSITPVHSAVDGGGPLTITGERLEGDAAVQIGTAEAVIESQGATRIIARIPPGSLGNTEVKVTIKGKLIDARPFNYAIERIVTVARADEATMIEKRTVVSRKEALLQAVGPLGVIVASDQKDLPTMVLRIPSDAALQAVTSNANVAGISELRPLRPDTVESLPLIHQDWVKELPEPMGGPFLGAGTTVLVLDSGLDWRNSFFRCPSLQSSGCRVAKMIEFAGNDGSDEDSTFHGTNVAAIVLSVAPGAKVISGDLLGAGTTSEAVVNAIQWAIDNRATYNIAAVNMSFSMPGSETKDYCVTDPVAAAVTFAHYGGLVMVASTGNDAHKDEVLVPACSPGAVRVGAVHDSGPEVDTETDFSNAWWLPFMVAPGQYITAAGHRMRGTSQAAPHVAGAAAVMRSIFPTATTNFIVSRLQNAGPLVASKNSLARPRRLDLYAAIMDQTFRPRPVEPHFEWTWSQETDGTPRPVADRPSLEIQFNERFAVDRNTRFSWLRFLPAGPAPEQTDIRRAQAFCRSGFGAGRNFRLPTRSELLTLFDFTAPFGARFDRTVLGAVPKGSLWTISPGDDYKDDRDRVWRVDSETGIASIGAASVGKAGFVCVSPIGALPTPAPQSRFTEEGSTLVDFASGLRWLKAGGPEYDYREAAKWCAARNDAGRYWRLPTARELISIANVTPINGNATETNLFGPSETRISASDHNSDPGSTASYGWWVLNEGAGTFFAGRQTGKVRCVENRDPKASRDGVHIGDLIIDGEGSDAYQRLVSSGFTTIRGDLAINAASLPRVSLQALEKVEGSVFIAGLDKATVIALPNLGEVTGGLFIENNKSVRRIDLRRLIKVGTGAKGGDLKIASNATLGADQTSGTNGDGMDAPILLGQLQEVGGALRIEGNQSLKAFGFKSLAQVGTDLVATGNATLERFVFNGLVRVGGRCIAGQACGMLEVALNAMMESFSLRNATELRWGINIDANGRLSDFSIGVPRIHAIFKVTRNTAFCPRNRVDTTLRTILRKGMIDDIEIRNNQPDTIDLTCSSRCPDENDCQLLGNPGGRRASAVPIRYRGPISSGGLHRSSDTNSTERPDRAADFAPSDRPSFGASRPVERDGRAATSGRMAIPLSSSDRHTSAFSSGHRWLVRSRNNSPGRTY